jgi:hypothetical protein
MKQRFGYRKGGGINKIPQQRNVIRFERSQTGYTPHTSIFSTHANYSVPGLMIMLYLLFKPEKCKISL